MKTMEPTADRDEQVMEDVKRLLQKKDMAGQEGQQA